ncbi:MAG: hypothetical protein OSJ70_05930 [Bacilli bacterium]|nr:hypothetical protein [Bacilli bacterium]
MKYMKFLLILFLLPLSVFADEDEMKIKFECPDEIKVKEQFSCQIKGLTDNLVSGIEYEFKLPSNLKFVSFEKDNSWEGDEENNLIILYGLEDKTQEFNIGKIVLIANEEIDELNIATEYLAFSDEKYQDHIVVKRDQIKNVNEMKSKEKKDNNSIYGIVVYAIIIIIVVAIILLLIKRRRKKE